MFWKYSLTFSQKIEQNNNKMKAKKKEEQSSGYELAISLLWSLIRSLVGELRYHKRRRMTRRNKEREREKENEIFRKSLQKFKIMTNSSIKKRKQFKSPYWKCPTKYVAQ